MLDYIFFHLTPYQAFTEFLQDQQIKFHQVKEYQESTQENGLMIIVDEDLDDDLLEKVEDYYDQMMDLNGQLVSAHDENEIAKAGISVNLKDGRLVMARLEPNLVYKLSTVLSHEELRTLVDAVVDAVEKPDERPLCSMDS